MPEANITVKKKSFPQLHASLSTINVQLPACFFPEPRLNTMPRNSSKEQTEHLAEDFVERDVRHADNPSRGGGGSSEEKNHSVWRLSKRKIEQKRKKNATPSQSHPHKGQAIFLPTLSLYVTATMATGNQQLLLKHSLITDSSHFSLLLSSPSANADNFPPTTKTNNCHD